MGLLDGLRYSEEWILRYRSTILIFPPRFARQETEQGFEVFPLDISQRDEALFCDVSDSASVEKCAKEIGAIDVLVNNAGIWKFSPLEDVDEDDFSKVLDVNLLGSFLCMKYFGKSMLTKGSGSIINIVSIAGAHANPSVGSYGPSKAALISLTQQAALEWGPRGIRCNAILPGTVETPSWHERVNMSDDPKQARIDFINRQAMGRLAQPEEIASLIAFACGETCPGLSNEDIQINAGAIW